ncbi:MAG: hypothetical protein EP298_01060 [Gammaproteobacteria bacterium]|nr:MAG: hypothetical protein EP298_01060 [Gammaproteobacteria bacterium]UTW41941.1 hypothetical protein KFE69_10570 [bacterium SCSIO 12844]
MGLSDNSENSFKMPQLQENWVKGLPDIFVRRVIWGEQKRNDAWQDANLYFERNLNEKKYKLCYKSEDKDQLQSQFYYFEIINTRRYLISDYYDITGEYKDLERSIKLAEDEEGNPYLIDFSGCQGEPIIHPYGVLLTQYMKEALKSGQRIDEDEFSTKISSASERAGISTLVSTKKLLECAFVDTEKNIFFIQNDLKIIADLIINGLKKIRTTAQGDDKKDYANETISQLKNLKNLTRETLRLILLTSYRVASHQDGMFSFGRSFSTITNSSQESDPYFNLASQLLNIDAKEIEIAKGNDFVALERLGVKRFAEIKTLMECKTANLIFFTEEINTELKEDLSLKV